MCDGEGLFLKLTAFLIVTPLKHCSLTSVPRDWSCIGSSCERLQTDTSHAGQEQS